MIAGAAQGDVDRRREFARTYLPVVRAYLGARWRGTRHMDALDDAVQDVFVDCFREEGALGRADPSRGARFRTFLYGVARNVALRHEERGRLRKETQGESGFEHAVPADESSLSVVFDRSWARALMRRAMDRQRQRAATAGAEALRRVELLRLRFQEGLPVRDIAARWGEDPAAVHRWFRKAREEFREALVEEVRFHHAGTPAEVERECAALLELLS